METDLNLTIEERMAIEEAEATEGARPHLPDDSVGYLWLNNFITSFLVARSIEGCSIQGMPGEFAWRMNYISSAGRWTTRVVRLFKIIMYNVIVGVALWF